VLDAGDGVSHAVPVYEGFAIPNSIRRIDVAGRDVTEELQRLLRKSGSVFHTSAEKEIVKAIKEKHSYVALDPKKEEKEWQSASNRGGQSKEVEYVLPDGVKLKIGPERFRAAEILFEPELIGLEWPGLHQIVVDSINRTDMDLRKALFGNIVLSGGSTMIKGFGDRLLHEVQRLAVKDMRIKIFAPPERLYSTWIGGSILAGLSTFRKMYVTIDDWHESKLLPHGTATIGIDKTVTNTSQIRTSSIRNSHSVEEIPQCRASMFTASKWLHDYIETAIASTAAPVSDVLTSYYDAIS
jgi:centractin